MIGANFENEIIQLGVIDEDQQNFSELPRG
jgi:hypothetical protein